MRRIKKQTPPADLARFVRRENPQKFEEIHDSQHFPKLYDECIVQLETEQENLSGYTEKPLKNHIHVDHYRKQEWFNTQDMIFGWNNMIADEHNNEFGADYKDKTLRLPTEYAKLINPVLEDPHHFLTYMDEGVIKPVDGLPEAEREKAEFTIKAFNLRHKLLTLLQGDAIRLVRTYKAQGLEYDEIMNALKDYGFTSAVEYALTEGPLPKDAGSLSQ